MPARARSFVPGVVPPPGLDATDGWWIPVRGAEVAIDAFGDAEPALLKLAGWSGETRPHYLGLLDELAVYAVDADGDIPFPDMAQLRGLRQVFGLLGEQLFTLAGRAVQIIEWERQHRFCGRCGTATEYTESERAKRCPNCGLLSFPRLSPAVITLVERGDEALLARHTRTTDGTYALVAGFVEPGESLEDAVQREIREEIGVEVNDIRYFGSQPWPFPNSLMLGFTAQYAGGEIAVDGVEIADARFFSYTAMPKVPPRISISRMLIDAYAAKHGVEIAQP